MTTYLQPNLFMTAYLYSRMNGKDANDYDQHVEPSVEGWVSFISALICL